MRRGLFSFREDPFRNHPDPRFFYPSPAYSRAYERLVTRASEHSGLILLLGRSGVGKTTMLLKLRQDLEAAGVCVIFPKIKQAALSSVLEQCCRSVGLDLRDPRANEPARALSDYLQSQQVAGKAIAVLIDDAHLLQAASLLGILDLVHAATGARSATSIVLAGHGDLEARLRSSELSKMKGAVVDRIALKPLESQQVGPFIRHRLWIVGYTGPDLFTDEAIGRIAEYANGIPSLINLICGLSLKFARVVSEATVSADAVEDMQKFLGHGGPSASSARPHTLETESIARLQRLYDLISTPYAGDGGTSAPELDRPGHLPQPARDKTFSERDLMNAISNALDWQPMAIEEEHADDALTANRSRSWAAGAVKPLAAGVALIALIAGGAAFLYQQETTSHTVSLTELKSPPEARTPNTDFAGIEKVLGEGPVEKPAPADIWQPTLTKGTQSGEIPTASGRRVGMEPIPDSSRSPPSPLIEQTLAAVADPPRLAVADAAGSEGAEVALSVTAQPAEGAGEEQVTVTIAGLPAGATLSAGLSQDDGTWLLAPTDLEGLKLSAGKGVSGDFPLTVTAISTVAGGDSATTGAELLVSLAAVADPPRLEVADAAGAEGAEVALSVAAQPAEGAGEEQVTVTIAGLPADATLSAGLSQDDGTWLLAPTDLEGLKLSAGKGVSGNFPLTVTAISTAAGGDSATTGAELLVSLAAVADPPRLEVADAAGSEGAEVALSVAAQPAEGAGEEQVTVTIAGLPAGAALSAGLSQDDGTWLLAPTDLEGLKLSAGKGVSGDFPLTVTAISTVAGGDSATTGAELLVRLAAVADPPRLEVADAAGSEGAEVALSVAAQPAEGAGEEQVTVTIAGLPAGAALSAGLSQDDGTWLLAPTDLEGLKLSAGKGVSGDFPLTVTAISTVAGGDSATTGAELLVRLAAVADPPRLEVADAAGSEGAEVALSVAAQPAEGAGEEQVTVTIAGLPAGATLSAGLSQDDGTWLLAPTDLEGLKLSAGKGVSGDFPLTVTAISTVAGGDSATTGAELLVRLAAVADPPRLEVADAAGSEGAEVALSVAAQPAEGAGEEQVTVTIAGLPAGATLSAGLSQDDGTWLLAPTDLEGLKLSAGKGVSGDFPLTVTAISTVAGGDSATTGAELLVRLAAVADPPRLEVADAAGSEGAEVALSVAAQPVEGAGEEQVTVTIAGLPAGATLSAGLPQDDGTWLLAPTDLEGLRLSAGKGVSGDFPLTVTAISTAAGGDSATTRAELLVTISATPEAPSEGEPTTPSGAPSIELLLSKGKDMLNLGDIASARLFFELAAEFGSPLAAKLMGETYDPLRVKEAGIIGLKGDPIRAIEWYKKAATAGDEGAVKNLTRLEEALGQ